MGVPVYRIICGGDAGGLVPEPEPGEQRPAGLPHTRGHGGECQDTGLQDNQRYTGMS